MTTTTNTSRYAAETEVPVERSKRNIELLLMRHGAEAYHTGWDQERDIIEFGWRQKQIRFVLPRPKRADYEITATGQTRKTESVSRAIEQADRQRWRALFLVVRAKLEAVEAGIAQFEQEFLAYVVIPGQNVTIGEILVPRLGAGQFDIGRLLPAAPVKEVKG